MGACLSWPPSYSRRSRLTRSRSRKPKRSLRSTWPSSGRLSRNWRRLKNVPNLLRLRFVINNKFKTLTLVQDSYKAPYLLSWLRISSINSEFKAVSIFTTLQTEKTQKNLKIPLKSSFNCPKDYRGWSINTGALECYLVTFCIHCNISSKNLYRNMYENLKYMYYHSKK